ncbi:glycosyltransferase [Mucilaginibacter calamicampi]|uniref:Glycosyltransferase n=1 Tax=Mucilaginibacter calamicampi TaxID=1302352 RepID=A0ABW2YUU4_9SPHI
MANVAPLISVVFTSYNHERYLKQAVDSLIGQTFKDFELIIIDDCSTDNSRTILQSYAQHPNVKLNLLEKNTGSYVKSSHLGALKATGKYILFAQCDDFSESEQLAVLAEKALQFPSAGVIFSKSRLIDQDGKNLGDDYQIRNMSFKKRCKSDTLLQGQEMRSFLSYACVIPNLSAALINRDLYFKSGGLPEKFSMAADWALWLALSELTDFFYVSEVLNNFRQHAATIRSKTKLDKQLSEILNVFTEHSLKFRLNKTQQNAMMVGFGSIWFNYFLEDPRNAKASIIDFYKKASVEHKHLLYYLMKGAFKKTGFIIENLSNTK